MGFLKGGKVGGCAAYMAWPVVWRGSGAIYFDGRSASAAEACRTTLRAQRDVACATKIFMLVDYFEMGRMTYLGEGTGGRMPASTAGGTPAATGWGQTKSLIFSCPVLLWAGVYG
jgi:hypothetical protein